MRTAAWVGAPTGAAQVRPGTPPRRARRPLHGVVLLDKPVGLSSQMALRRVQRAFGADKAGHTGTLDPLASGLLPICLGAATKFSHLALEADKGYTATLILGQTRRGGDREGEVLRERPVDVDSQHLEQVLAAFTGPLQQVPPMHSALKHQGRPLYAYAREGLEVARAPRKVVVRELTVLSHSDVELTLSIRCSKGTYIRTLAEDIGEALGCGAHLGALRRTGSGALCLDDAVSLDALESLEEAARMRHLRPVDTLLAALPAVTLDAPESGRFLTGLRRRTLLSDAAQVRVYGPEPGALLGLAHITAGKLIADRLLNPEEARAAACLTSSA